MLLCLMLSMIPTVILGTFSMVKCRELLYRQEEVFVNNTLEQTNQSLEYFLLLYSNAMNSLVWDKSIQNAVNKEYTSNYERFLAKSEVFDVRLPMVSNINADVLQVTIYTDTNMYPYGNRIAALEDIQNESWYKQAITTYSPFFVRKPGSDNFLMICGIPNTSYKNVIVITLTGEKILNTCKTLFDTDYAVGIYDQKGQIFFKYVDLETEYRQKLFFRPLLNEMLEKTDKATFACWDSSDNEFGWSTIIIRPYQKIIAKANSLLGVVAGIIFLCILQVFFLGNTFTSHIVTPLEKLTENLDHIDVNNFEVTVKSTYNDEIAHLIAAFKVMAERLQGTINELYVNRIMKQEYRFQMLQAQINPHFLYNCLSMINGKAIRAEQPEIARTALLLSTFYRTTLNKGNSHITMREEWKNAMAYVELQKIVHAYSFVAECWIDEQLLSCQVINMIIQPLIENAILHGIDYREDEAETGKVIIRGEKIENEIQITVEDNGCGMDEKMCKSILTEETKGYGIMNVNQRIKLYFGENYGISYESEEGKGTKARIRLPLMMNEDKN